MKKFRGNIQKNLELGGEGGKEEGRIFVNIKGGGGDLCCGGVLGGGGKKPGTELLIQGKKKSALKRGGGCSLFFALNRELLEGKESR